MLMFMMILLVVVHQVQLLDVAFIVLSVTVFLISLGSFL